MQHGQSSLGALALGALGIVYGDIGTSPLYSLRECFTHYGHLNLSHDNVLGVLSLLFWTIIVIICIKYMMFVMKADNKGEGGILSLMTLAIGGEKNSDSDRLNKRGMGLLTVGLMGAALLYGDGVITPAISVLSAVEGLSLVTPIFAPYVVFITAIILTLLFFVQRVGTGRIGFFFGPLILIWFICIGSLGLSSIIKNPFVLSAVSPTHAIEFFLHNGKMGLFVLGSVFLAVTGGEALYADMGHFGRRPIRLAWFLIAMPALLLNYFGQGALLLSDPSKISNPFYHLAPSWFLWPLVVISTIATVIASQALISGVFSLTRQAVQLGFCPRIAIIHTSSREIGQIYIPFINWALYLGVIWLVFAFKTSSDLASAYGIAVTATMLITTLLAYEVARKIWGWSRWKAGALCSVFIVVDGAFFLANIIKVHDGGWVPLAMGAVVYLLMTTWKKGRKVLAARLKEKSKSISEFIEQIKANPPLRIPGSAIYMAGDPWGVPVPLLHNLKHNKVLHERVAILTISTKDVPTIDKKNRVVVEELAPQFYRVLALYGYMETPKIKHVLEALRHQNIHFSILETTFVLGRETILPSGDQPMPLWREKLFAIMARNAQRPTAFFKIPPNQVIEVGIQVEI